MLLSSCVPRFVGDVVQSGRYSAILSDVTIEA